MYIPSERNVLSVVKNIEELDNLPLSGYKALVNKSSGETFILEEKSGRAVPIVCASRIADEKFGFFAGSGKC